MEEATPVTSLEGSRLLLSPLDPPDGQRDPPIPAPWLGEPVSPWSYRLRDPTEDRGRAFWMGTGPQGTGTGWE